MIPYILAAVGGYLIGQSRKDEMFAKGGTTKEKEIYRLTSASGTGERGEASIKIQLKRGVITVYHGKVNYPLYSWEAKEGDWNKIWERIYELGSGEKMAQGGISVSSPKESRERDVKRNRVLLSIGDKKFHLSQEEAKTLMEDLKKFVNK